jgi:chromosome segregation ATPase
MDEELKKYLDTKFEKIGVSIHAVESRLHTIETRLETVETRLHTIETRLHTIETRLDEHDGKFAAIDVRFKELEERLIENMRNMQTELLRGFEAFSASVTIRVRKLEADQSNLDTALSSRVEVVEKRLHEIEQRLGGAR